MKSKHEQSLRSETGVPALHCCVDVKYGLCASTALLCGCKIWPLCQHCIAVWMYSGAFEPAPHCCVDVQWGLCASTALLCGCTVGPLCQRRMAVYVQWGLCASTALLCGCTVGPLSKCHIAVWMYSGAFEPAPHCCVDVQ